MTSPAPPLATDQQKEPWGRVLAEVEKVFGRAEVEGWLRRCSLVSLEGGVADLAAPTALHAERVRGLYGDLIRGALSATLLRVEIRPVALPDPPKEEDNPKRVEEVANRAAPSEPLLLNPDYTFENFVVGPCNRFAHAAARGVADRPAAAFNPLFLYGSVGLGKTHLVQAVAHELVAASPSPRILFLSCEQFVNHFIAALQRGDIDAFRNRYRHVDVLVVDDIQILANKTRTQEEFFHTFNALHNAKKQIVLSSDAPPEEIPSLQDRLVSRFQWG